MRVLLVRGNPRKAGYTERVTNLFLRGLREAGAQVRDVDLATRSIAPCDGCFHCWLATPGQCVHGDDMGELLEQVIDCDVLACATPVYYFSMSSRLKTFFERTFPLAQPGLVPSGLGLTRNTIRHPEKWKDKKFVSIVTGALREPRAYGPINETFRLIADSLDLELAGQLTRPESSLLDYPLSKPKTLKRIETAFIQAGREIVQAGRVSPATVEAAGAPLSASADHFRAYSNIYWEQACAMGADAFDPAAVQRKVGYDTRILMREMVRCLDPNATSRVCALIAFEFPDQQQAWQVKIDKGECRLIEGSAPNADLRVRCQSRVWAGLFTREMDVREILRNGELLLQGDKSLFSRLDRFFPPPST